MAKKKKIKNEDPSINFRLPEELKQEIYKEASQENKTVSNYLRDHLQEFIDGSLFEKEIANYKNNSFINSTEFLKLVTWIISQKLDPTCSLSNETLNELIQTLKKTNEHMPLNIVVEFDKVLADLLRVIQEHPSTRSFYFCGTAFTKPTFNYKKLMDYILAI